MSSQQEIRDAFRAILLPPEQAAHYGYARIFREQLRTICGCNFEALCRAYEQSHIEAYEAGRRGVYFKLYQIAGTKDEDIDKIVLGGDHGEPSAEPTPQELFG